MGCSEAWKDFSEDGTMDRVHSQGNKQKSLLLTWRQEWSHINHFSKISTAKNPVLALTWVWTVNWERWCSGMYVHTLRKAERVCLPPGSIQCVPKRLPRGKTDPLADSRSLCYLEEEHLTGATYTGQSKVDRVASPYRCASLPLPKERTSLMKLAGSGWDGNFPREGWTKVRRQIQTCSIS